MAAFVGRRFELDALEHFGRTAAGGGVTAAIVVGEPGSGKSRLLTEAAGRTGLPRRFAVTGYEPERQVPFAAASDLLRDLAESEAGRGRLGALLFEAPEEESPTLEPVRIFEAAHRALRSKGPALVLVDDVQWVDDLSLALCHYLVRAAGARRGGRRRPRRRCRRRSRTFFPRSA
jgi:predicted ATPase